MGRTLKSLLAILTIVSVSVGIVAAIMGLYARFRDGRPGPQYYEDRVRLYTEAGKQVVWLMVHSGGQLDWEPNRVKFLALCGEMTPIEDGTVSAAMDAFAKSLSHPNEFDVNAPDKLVKDEMGSILTNALRVSLSNSPRRDAKTSD